MELDKFDIEDSLNYFREQIKLAERNIRVYKDLVAFLESKKNK